MKVFVDNYVLEGNTESGQILNAFDEMVESLFAQIQTTFEDVFGIYFVRIRIA